MMIMQGLRLLEAAEAETEVVVSEAVEHQEVATRTGKKVPEAEVLPEVDMRIEMRPLEAHHEVGMRIEVQEEEVAKITDLREELDHHLTRIPGNTSTEMRPDHLTRTKLLAKMKQSLNYPQTSRKSPARTNSIAK